MKEGSIEEISMIIQFLFYFGVRVMILHELSCIPLLFTTYIADEDKHIYIHKHNTIFGYFDRNSFMSVSPIFQCI